ncbi:segregation/condensation protein A [Streptomyces lunaelactis]|nr:segregation/condensation protein A [Streptomyces lunaelactis]NUK53636.1 segregation/condensation protein A [Streptomyces lunaelactis]
MGRGPGTPRPESAVPDLGGDAGDEPEGAAGAVSPNPPLPETGGEPPDPRRPLRDDERGPAAGGLSDASRALHGDGGGPEAYRGSRDSDAVSGALGAVTEPLVDVSAPGGSAGEPGAPTGPEPTAFGPTGGASTGAVAGAGPVDDGRFKVRLANFEGPFDLLLQLISKHKLDVTEVALSKVTDEFMVYIHAMGPDWDLDQTTEFLVVAATLLDLKAARLLPAAEVEDEADLALLEARDLLFARLLQYRAYKQIAEIFSARLEEEGKRYPRTVGLEAHHAELLPEVVISIGAEGFARLAVKAMQPRPEPQVYIDHIHAPLVSVREQAEIVVARLREGGEVSFRELAADAPDTLTVVARFLALLELYREKAVVLDQEEALGELMVRWTGGEGAGRPPVTDEFDSEVHENPDEEEDA